MVFGRPPTLMAISRSCTRCRSPVSRSPSGHEPTPSSEFPAPGKPRGPQSIPSHSFVARTARPQALPPERPPRDAKRVFISCMLAWMSFFRLDRLCLALCYAAAGFQGPAQQFSATPFLLSPRPSFHGTKRSHQKHPEHRNQGTGP